MKQDTLSALLAELSRNRSDEDRARSRAQVQQQYQECESKLTSLVKSHREHIRQTREICRQTIQSVNESRRKCQAVKDRITSCMDMLHFNRENIKGMWLESFEHKYAHRILSEIEELRKVPRKVNDSLINKKLEHASEVIVASIKVSNSNMCKAEALDDLRLELHNLQEKLYQMVLEDLRKNLHLTEFILDHFGDINDVTYDDIFTNKIPKSDLNFKDLLDQISFDDAYINVLLNCLATMKRLPDAMDFLKDNCQSKLDELSHQISKFMYDIIQKSFDVPVLDLPLQKQHVFLTDLMENIIATFQKICFNYNKFFSILRNIMELNGIRDFQFQMDDIYSKLQASLEYFVSYYLESHPSSSTSPKDSFTFANSQNAGDVATFFNTQDLPAENNAALFKFSNSCHGMNFKKYSKEAKTSISELDSTEKSSKVILICRPELRNIIIIFNPFMQLVKEIEHCLNLSDGDHSPLHAFLYDSANLFLDQVNSDMNKMLKNASANLDAWNTSPVVEYSSFRSNTEKHVLSCSQILDNIMKELQNLMTCLPDYTDHFLRLICYVILDYKDMYHKAFKQMFEEEQNMLSISWARDRDIRRLMKSFLNWRHLEESESVDIVESPEEIRLRNKEESELLIRNLRSEDATACEIITDTDKLSNLALLQENVIWFSVELLKFIKNFNQSRSNVQISCDANSKNNSVENNSITNAVSGLRKVIKEYEDFADMCLLALHLEVRARCFHYLLTFSAHEISVESNFVQELDTAVKHLTSDLLQIDEVLLPILTPKEFKYVFEGLGELVASLMILIVSNMNKINETVVLKIDRNIFIIQCCLANITMAREVSLERARQFIDLLKLTHEEILDHIVEEGPRFNEHEYASVFRLISSSVSEVSHGLVYYIDKLKLIFKRLTANTGDTIAVS